MNQKKFMAAFERTAMEVITPDIFFDIHFKTKNHFVSARGLMREIAEKREVEMVEVLDELLRIVKAKNHDYSVDDDAFANFNLAKEIDIEPVQAVQIRMLDKISRINTLKAREGEAEVDESLEDTQLDLFAYMVIMQIMIDEGI